MAIDDNILQPNNITFDDAINLLPQNPNNVSTLLDIEKMVNTLLGSLQKLDRNALRYEISEMTVPMEKNPTTYSLNEGLALAQGYRDRLSEILNSAQSEFKVRKRCLEMLFDAVNLISKASSADKRKGEATLRYPTMVLQTEAAEIFSKEVEMIYANMRATFDSISRQISVMNIQVSLGERRQGNPNGTDVIPQSSAEEVSGNKSLNWDNF